MVVCIFFLKYLPVMNLSTHSYSGFNFCLWFKGFIDKNDQLLYLNRLLEMNKKQRRFKKIEVHRHYSSSMKHDNLIVNEGYPFIIFLLIVTIFVAFWVATGG